jgi:FkbM family methyltransferase
MLSRLSSLVGLARVDLSTQLKAMPRLGAALERLVSIGSRPLHGRVAVVPSGAAAGLRFRIGPVGTVWASGKMEPSVQRTLRAIIRPGDVFFDVGANVGFFTILGARLVGESGSVVAFEPEPENVAALRDNVGLNAFSNVVVVASAVSSSSGVAHLQVPHRATARLLPVDRVDVTASQVVTTSIDDFVTEHPELKPEVVKIDVEGHEAEVIRGMRETLARLRPIVLCELHRTNLEVAAAFDEAGYRTTVLDGPGPVDASPWWAHVLAVPLSGNAS